MSAEENKALVRRHYAEVLSQRNLAVIEELFAPTFVSRLSDGPSVDLAQFKEAAKMSLAAFPDLHATVEDQVAEADKVVTRWIARGTHQGEFAGIPPTGKSITLTGIHIHRVADGKIVELWEETDLLV
jgi:steroid delta-isomerase-like uncharacterized protein